MECHYNSFINASKIRQNVLKKSKTGYDFIVAKIPIWFVLSIFFAYKNILHAYGEFKELNHAKYANNKFFMK